MAAPPSSPVVLITGSSHGGIGYSLCEAFATKGCTVYASARRLETISTFSHPSIRPLVMDVTSDTSVHKAVEQIIEEAGRVDIIVANAGVPCHGPILDVPIETAKQALDTNVLGVLRLARAVFPYMASRKRGTFITIGSVMGYNASPWAGMYAATKAAAHAITETLQMEAKALSPDIRVMLVVTGGVKSNLANNSQFALPPTSLFQTYLPNIIARIQSSQTGPSMPTADYAQGVVNAALRKGGAPRTLEIGGHTMLFKIFRWLPRGLVMFILWRQLGRLRK
ncbi:short-chain dehydrogenase/reductase family protein [Rhizoctonia solani AG-3 Rhs1AP]|uniref:Short-chain dehydrogenase/reductase family protein n=2 Tax=Rhizoctonia solani AG-3 TaxID=1086053 RepID=A0A074RS40_9AGAM|nr:short-chain dehydrogenase/reductase family protein [Rhizoctonia solani AG-3 Rhs1AP]KEP49916.1 short-chain dehydrogenase/reductase family protein [Rhizoctonia solani 123E]